MCTRLCVNKDQQLDHYIYIYHYIYIIYLYIYNFTIKFFNFGGQEPAKDQVPAAVVNNHFAAGKEGAMGSGVHKEHLLLAVLCELLGIFLTLQCCLRHLGPTTKENPPLTRFHPWPVAIQRANDGMLAD